uniref:Uncharacterized protein n=1 Tax=Anopheles merus TaxID=30066 RepID=A0A182VGU4_ANOME
MNNNSSRTHLPWMFNNSLAIRQEIQRFESVHPSIYAIYHLIDLIPDVQVAQQIRDHVVCIEDACTEAGWLCESKKPVQPKWKDMEALFYAPTCRNGFVRVV